jgi:hypothetical protein
MRTRFSITKKRLILISGLVFFSANAFSDTLTVSALSDIYAAGHSSVPATIYPGDFSPSAVFSAAANQVLAFSSVTGAVGCNFTVTNGPDGTCWPGVNTTVTSYGGLSGISASGKNMFLVGVFLDNTEPSGAGPITLSYDFGTPGSLNTTDASFSPELNQVFFIGDGLTGTGSGQVQNFLVPDTASRLYLGFADSFDSVPYYYADDVGSLTATFAITGSAAVPEPSTMLFVSGGLLVGLSCFKRRLVVRRKP